MNCSTHQRRGSVVPKTICDDLTAFSARTYDFAVSKMSQALKCTVKGALARVSPFMVLESDGM